MSGENQGTKKGRLVITVHVLQYDGGAGCINRDDTNAVKTLNYGGTVRERVSSQAWKAAVRAYWREHFEASRIGTRTKKVAKVVAKEIAAMDPGADAEGLAAEALTKAGLDLKGGEAKALVLISDAQAKALAGLAVKGEKDAKLYEKAFCDNPSVDTVLFGRMVSGKPALGYEGAAQVNHAFSVCRAEIENDYETGRCDLEKDSPGAPFIGNQEFTSGVLYRCWSINVAQMAESLGDETPDDVANLVTAILYAFPGGKQHSFYNLSDPYLAYIELRDDYTATLSPAFGRALEPSGEGVEKLAAETLAGYVTKHYEKHARWPMEAWHACDDGAIEGLGECVNFPELAKLAGDRTRRYMEEEKACTL